MKKILKYVIMAALAFMMAGVLQISVYAAEQNSFTILRMITAAEEIEARKEPSDTAEISGSFEAGSDLLVVEDVDSVWLGVIYKGEVVYVKKELTSEKSEFTEEMEEVEEEFLEISEESTFLAETLEKKEKETKRNLIWGGLIVVLILAIIVVGVIGKLSDKEENKKSRNRKK